MNRVLIDSDVILDFFFDRKPFSEFSARILSLCQLGRVTGFLTPVILSNVYYLLSQQAPHEVVLDKLKQLLQILDVLPMDREIVLMAMSSEFKDFEDALQNYSATQQGSIQVILTRNVKDYRKSELSVMTPGDFLKVWDSNQ